MGAMRKICSRQILAEGALKFTLRGEERRRGETGGKSTVVQSVSLFAGDQPHCPGTLPTRQCSAGWNVCAAY